MVTVDQDKCTHCNLCLVRFSGYCMSDTGRGLAIDYTVCNQCQKCISLCPAQALLMNGISPEKINGPIPILPEDMKELLNRRRSIKQFRKAHVSKDVLLDIADAAAYAPNQNKNIVIRIIDDPELLELIGRRANRFVKRLYTLLFGFRPLAALLELASRQFRVIHRKMAYGLDVRRATMHPNTAAVYILTGNSRIPVTEASAQYLMATMAIYSLTLGVGSCLMDSLKLTLNHDGRLKRRLHIRRGTRVLGVLTVGYSGENILNKPIGYRPDIIWNEG